MKAETKKRQREGDETLQSPKRAKTITKEFLDQERIDASVKPRQNTKDLRCKTYTDQERQHLINLFPWQLRKHSEYRPERKGGEPAKIPTKKVYRRERPSLETEYDWRHVEQNSNAWYAIRSGSLGASSIGCIMGFDKSYRTNLDRWREDTGLVAEPERSIAECLPCDLGHRDEPICRLIASILLGAKIEETGSWIHPTIPFLVSSPDGLTECLDDGMLLNKHTANHSLRGLFENKLTIMWALLNKLGCSKWGFPHAIRPYHALQMLCQGACVSPLTTHCDYCSAFFYNERSGPKPFELVDDKSSSTVAGLKMGEILLSRVWMNRDMQNAICQYAARHVQFVRSNKQPKILDHPETGIKIKWVPLVQTIWYLTGYPPEFSDNRKKEAGQQYIDTSLVLSLVGSQTAQRPSNWIGEFPPKKANYIKVFYDQVPLESTLTDLGDML